MNSFTNRLAHETSPYLRQHAHNPVDWYPWSPEALQKAQDLDRPIFLSIGYSACHWCHVMEHESFEDEETARILNQHFVSIKVDREERPDLDQIYMTAVQIMTQHGGWPMSMFLTPELRPFFGGTYFPPQDRHGMPSFKRVLLSVAQAWTDKRDTVAEQAKEFTAHLQSVIHLEGGAEATVGAPLLKNIGAVLGRAFDPVHGGFGRAPKFPHPMELRLLLRVWKRFGDDNALAMATRTLDHMAMGGMYDHLGGGFHRYSTDARWLVPHFEKMLYDNALLSVAYLEAFQATGNPYYRTVVEETLGYILREMTSPEGPFYSTQDADSEGVEGKFFVWSAAEIDKLLGKEEAKLFKNIYDVSPEGNWEEHNILNRGRSDEQEAKVLGLTEDELRRRLEASKRILLAERGRRIWPGRDDKVLTSWNGLMINAFALAYQVLEKPEYAQAAGRAADFMLNRMRTDQGRLLRTYSAGSEPKLNAYLEDYAFLIDALVSLYEAVFEPRWLQAALELTDVLCDQFWDEREGGFFYTGRDHEKLIARTKDPHDSSIPSGNAVAVTAMLRLAKFTGRRELLDKAEATLRLFSNLLETSPMAGGQMLLALDFHVGPVQEFAVVGDPKEEETRQVIWMIRQGFRPNKVVALKTSSVTDMPPLLAGKTSAGKVTTYICQDFTCQAPIIGAEALASTLTS